MAESETKKPELLDPNKIISQELFLWHVAEGINHKRKYCFILGAGASAKSGISSGQDLIKKWQKELKNKLIKNQLSKEAILEAMAKANVPAERYDTYFGDDYQVNSEHYFDFYDIYYSGRESDGYRDMQEMILKGKPSIGYYALAEIIRDTDVRIVITTNFDTLTEDTLLAVSATHPLVASHESLADFIVAEENQDRPIVAKVHRDIFCRPKNRNKDLKSLEKNWKAPLKSILSQCIPIVIGYAGGDETLMKLLLKSKMKGLYWCAYEGAEIAAQNEKVYNLLNNGPNRYVIKEKGRGFDELMMHICDALNLSDKMKELPQRIRDNAEVRAKTVKETWDAFHEKKPETALGEGKPDSSTPPQPDTSKPIIESDSQSNIEKWKDVSSEALETKDMLAYKDGNYEESLKICRELVRREPENARYLNSLGVTLQAMKRYDDAYAEKAKAVKLEPENAEYHKSLGVTLQAMKRYPEANAELSKAVEIAPENAEYRFILALLTALIKGNSPD